MFIYIGRYSTTRTLVCVCVCVCVGGCVCACGVELFFLFFSIGRVRLLTARVSLSGLAHAWVAEGRSTVDSPHSWHVDRADRCLCRSRRVVVRGRRGSMHQRVYLC